MNTSEDDSYSENCEINENVDKIIVKKAKLSRKCYFQPSWITNGEFTDWISTDNDSKYNALCTCCRKVFSVASGGVRDVRSHGRSAKHIQAMSTRRFAGGMLQFLTKDTKPSPVTAHNKKVTECELKVANFVARKNLPLSLMDDISENVADWFPDSKIAKDFSSKRTKGSMMIKNVIGKLNKEDLSTKLRSCHFTLLVDESTDISTTEKMALVVIYFDVEIGKVQYRFYRLVDLKEAKAESIFAAIKACLEEDKIPLANVMALGTDGANVMIGARNSVLSRFRDAQPNIFHIHCTCHVAALCAADACKTFPKFIEQLCRDIHSHFSHSCKRLQLYKEFQEFVEADTLRILQLCSTRWLSLLECINRIVNQYEALSSYFQSSDECDRLVTVDRISTQLQNPVVKCYFLFLQAVLPMFTQFNKMFQSNSPILPDLYAEANQLLKSVLGYYIRPQVLLLVEDLTSFDHLESTNFKSSDNIFIGYQTKLQLQQVDDPSTVQKFIVDVLAFYTNAAGAIKKRMPISNRVLKLMSVLKPTNRTAVEQSEILELAQLFPQIVSPADFDCLEAEFIDYQVADLSNVLADGSYDDFWHQIGQMTRHKEYRFPRLSKFAQTMLALPHGTAEVERVFSAVSLLKTNLRNKLSTPMLESLLTVRNGPGKITPTMIDSVNVSMYDHKREEFYTVTDE